MAIITAYLCPKALLLWLLISATLLGLTGCGVIFAGGAMTGLVVAHDRRGVGIVTQDTATALRVQRRFEQAFPAAVAQEVNVIGYNGAILLTGRVPDEATRAKVLTLARSVQHVQRLYDELSVGAPTDFTVDNGDTYVTASVKTALFSIREIPDFNPTRVKVTTSRGVVYLMGLLTPDESRAVVAVTRRVRGVRRLVTLFEEYTPPAPVPEALAAS